MEALFNEKALPDNFIASLTDNVFVMYPFISVQKEFGYSDVTNFNNNKNQVTRLFDNASKKIEEYGRVAKKYDLLKNTNYWIEVGR